MVVVTCFLPLIADFGSKFQCCKAQYIHLINRCRRKDFSFGVEKNLGIISVLYDITVLNDSVFLCPATFTLQLDSWSVILNGSVEVTYPDGRTEILCMGNSFGVSPTMEKEYMKGVMRTKVDDCQVECIIVQAKPHTYRGNTTGQLDTALF